MGGLNLSQQISESLQKELSQNEPSGVKKLNKKVPPSPRGGWGHHILVSRVDINLNLASRSDLGGGASGCVIGVSGLPTF